MCFADECFNNKSDRIKNLGMLSARTIATKKKEVFDKPAHAHLRRLNRINQYVDIIVILYF